MSLAVATVVLLFMELGYGQSARHCPFDDGICYRFELRYPKTFWEAEKQCESEGGTLVIIKTEKLNDYITARLQKYFTSGNVWIGLSDDHLEGNFTWVDGTPADKTFMNLRSLDNCFDIMREKDCVAIDPRNGYWEDLGCTRDCIARPNRLPFICQFKPFSTVSTTATSIRSSVTTQGQTTKHPVTSVQTTRPTTIHPQTIPLPTCPPFVCLLECGMDGYQVDQNRCSICECDV